MLSKKTRTFYLVLLLTIFMASPITSRAQEPGNADAAKTENPEDLQKFMEEGMKEIDYYSLEELLNVEIEVASLFSEDELVVGSTVSSISPEEWTRLGAKRTHDAFNNQLNVMTYPSYSNTTLFVVRGYAQSGDQGTSWLLDGVPVIPFSTGILTIPNWELGTLNGIEMIKGPGSAIYGSDAFHGVVSLNTFESEKDSYSVGLGGGYSIYHNEKARSTKGLQDFSDHFKKLEYPVYYDGNFKASQGLYENFIRFDFAVSASGQGDKNLEVEFDDPSYGFGTLTTRKGKFIRDDKFDSQTGVLKATIKPVDKLKIKLGGYFSRFNAENGPAPNLYKPIYMRGNVEDRFDMFKMGKGSIIYNMPKKIDVEVDGYFWESESGYETNWPEELYPLLTTLSVPFLGKQIDPAGIKETISDRRMGTDLTIKQKDNAINLQWVIGYSYSGMEIPRTTREAKIQYTDDYVPWQNGKANSDGKSRYINSNFLQLKWGVVNKELYVIAGYRLDIYSDFGSQFTPRGGIILLPTEKSSIKALYGRSFRAGTGEELYGSNWIVGNKDIKPETIDVYELAYILKSGNGKLNVNGFYSLWTEGINSSGKNPDTSSPYTWMFINTAKNRAYGGEISGYYSFKPFAVNLGLAYTFSEELGIKNPDDPTKKIDREYSAFPEYSAIAGLYYTLEPLKLNFLLNNRILKNMSVVPSGDDLTTDPDTLPLYWRMDLNVNKIVANKLDVSFNVNNLLNRKNAVSAITSDPKGLWTEPGVYVICKANYKF